MTTTNEQTATEIESIRTRIVEALAEGKPTGDLERQLVEARTAEATRLELDTLRPQAERRRQRREQAAALVEPAKAQSEAIDRFLAARDAVIGPLLELLPKAGELVSLQNSATVLRGFVAPALAEFLPPGFTTPVITGKDGVSDCHDRAAEALYYIRSGCGLLQSLQRENRAVLGQVTPTAGTDDDEDDSADEVETVGVACSICRHERATDIVAALESGRSLRDIGAEFNVSKSALSRHRGHLLMEL